MTEPVAPATNSPPLWHVFDQLAPSLGADALGFRGPVGDVNRFHARYRAARALRDIVLDGYSTSVRLGYAGLCRLLLAYSAFEYLLTAIGVERRQAATLLTVEEHGAAAERIRGIPGYEPLSRAAHSSLERATLRNEIDQLLNNGPCDVLSLAACVRHGFAHGHLAPSASGGEAGASRRICEVLSEVLFLVMDREFERRLHPFVSRL
jgi:hypothetical protein